MTDIWESGKAYSAGSMAIPRASAAVTQSLLTNADFEAGASGWALGAGWSISTATPAYQGTWRASIGPGAGPSKITNNNEVPVVPGQFLSVSAYLWTVGIGNSAFVGITWRTAAHADIIDVAGNDVIDTAGLWRASFASGIAPANAAYAVVFAKATTAATIGGCAVDAFTWNYAALAAPGAFLYEATTAGVSASTEPVWPTVLAGTVVDGTVTWTARAANRIVWKAVPVLKTGATEPSWPTFPGTSVSDGTISWRATTRVIEDPNCPQTKVATIIASKVWSPSIVGDIVRFCAAVDARDWTSANDAGYLATGLHDQGSTECRALGIYRGRLVPLTSSTLQMWDVDEDPANNALADAMEGVGSIYHRAMQAVANDLYFLTALGVRSVGIAAGAQNFQAGDVGMPIDDLVQAQMEIAAAAGIDPIALYFPAAGQFWLCFNTQVFVYAMNRVGSVGAWSRYVFPFGIRYHAQLDNTLYLRDLDGVIRKLDANVNYDQVRAAGVTINQYYDGVVQWPWLEMGRGGDDAAMEAFDIVGKGTPTVQFGYDQVNQGIFTDAYTVDADTLTGEPISMPLTAPTFSPKITYVGAPGNFWELKALNMYFTN